MREFLLVGVGGWAGAVCRYGLDRWITQRMGSSFPHGTFCVNLLGCLIIGLVGTWALEKTSWVPPALRLLVGIGFVGAFTTFSTYILEALRLYESGKPLVSALYLTASVAGGLVATGVGVAVARALAR